MRRLLVHVEGQTERDIVNDLLRPHLANRGYGHITARLFGTAQRNEHRGGVRPWPEVRHVIIDHLREDSECLVTIMVDYYGMPTGWPGRAKNTGRNAMAKAAKIEDAIAADISRQSGKRFDPRRFQPFVVMHEFEALLFSDCAAFAASIRRPDLADKFQAIRADFASPEDINDTKQTAPSKRIATSVAKYQKRVDGPAAIAAIGLVKIRAACPHFNAWLTGLETWPARLTA